MVAIRWILLALSLGLLLFAFKMRGRAEPFSGPAVFVDVCVAEQDVKRVAREVHNPVMKALKLVPGAIPGSSLTTGGKTQHLVLFRDGATRRDLAAVQEALNRVVFAADIGILSRHVELAQPLGDGRFPHSQACTEYQRQQG